ncbi:MAG: hypothetical protein QOH35_1964 [Acidobacteriaceae bacterium]|nr:hypothetical protein [Acidobacteriaceae bacterium]
MLPLHAQGLLQLAKVESVLTTNPGCPISRSFFARYGIPLPYPRNFEVYFVFLKPRSLIFFPPTQLERYRHTGFAQFIAVGSVL